MNAAARRRRDAGQTTDPAELAALSETAPGREARWLAGLAGLYAGRRGDAAAACPFSAADAERREAWLTYRVIGLRAVAEARLGATRDLLEGFSA